VEKSIAELISHMKRVQPAGWNQPLAWQRDFLAQAIQTKQISKDVLFDLCDAFYGPQPRVQPIATLPEGAAGFQIGIAYGNPWSDNSNLGIGLLWELKQLSLDGKQLRPAQVLRSGEHLTVFCDLLLPPGNHVLTMEFDCAYVDSNALGGLSASELPAAQWPTPRKRWTTTVTVPVKVEPAAEEP
jgi:hypothetical protein